MFHKPKKLGEILVEDINVNISPANLVTLAKWYLFHSV